MIGEPDMPRHLFVYGTLRAGDVRWRFLEPFVVDHGFSDSVPGRLFDTGLDYPAAIFDRRAEARETIVGHTYALLDSSLEHCLEVIDGVEDTVGGRYRRITVTTERGVVAHAYEYGSGLELAPIESGDWLMHRALRAPGAHS